MAVQHDFIKKMQVQVNVLEKLVKAAQGGIERANEKIKQLEDGKSVEDVFPVAAEQSSAAQGGGGKDPR